MLKKSIILALSLALVLAVFPVMAAENAELTGYSSKKFQYVAFGSYPTDADGTEQPILWRVLRSEDGQAYLLSEYILFASPVHADYWHYTDWVNSDLYAYLNSEFKNDAFSAAEQAALVPCWEDDGLVTLVSGDELRDASIGFDSNNARLCESTAWAKRERPDNKKLQLMIYSKGHKYSPWWSRTISTDNVLQQRRVMDEGKTGRLSVGNPDMGVRPAIYVDLSLLVISGGSGTKDAPFLLESTAEVSEITENEPAPEEPVEEPTDDPEDQPDEELPVKAEPTAEEEPIEEVQPEEVSPSEEPEQAEEDIPEDETEKTASLGAFTAAADKDRINALFPSLTEQGFLPDGEEEFVHIDEAEGLWLYASQTLRIEINRRTGTNSKKQPLRWYEAQIFTRDESELFDLYPYDETKYTNAYALTLADEIVQKHHLVFATNSDYFIYRVGRDKEEKQKNPNNLIPIGIEIRDGEVLYSSPKKSSSSVYPPLDYMVMYKDGSVKMFQNEIDGDARDRTKAGSALAEEWIADGATDCLSFGPILVENGAVSPRSTEFGNTPNPRTAFGYVEPGYYICVMVESRIAESKGESCVWLGQKMAELGCETAFNLDGGATSTMIFMGKQINKSGNYGDITNRKQNEVLGIGTSPNVN